MLAFPPMPLAAPCSFSGSRSVSLHDPAGSTSASIEEVLHRAATANSDRRLTSGTAMAAFRPMPSASPDVHGDGRVAKSDGSGTSGNAMLAFPSMPLATPRSTAATGGAKPDGSWTSGTRWQHSRRCRWRPRGRRRRRELQSPMAVGHRETRCRHPRRCRSHPRCPRRRQSENAR